MCLGIHRTARIRRPESILNCIQCRIARCFAGRELNPRRHRRTVQPGYRLLNVVRADRTLDRVAQPTIPNADDGRGGLVGMGKTSNQGGRQCHAERSCLKHQAYFPARSVPGFV